MAIDDLLYVQDELSGEVLDRYDRLRPGALEARSHELRRAMVRIARVKPPAEPASRQAVGRASA